MTTMEKVDINCAKRQELETRAASLQAFITKYDKGDGNGLIEVHRRQLNRIATELATGAFREF
jgi:hypothetical protein